MKVLSFLSYRTGTFSNLSPEEEVQAFRQWRMESSIVARNRIVLGYLKLVQKMAVYRSQRSPCDLDSLFSAGTLGLFRALDSFDETRGIRFATYATWWIRQAMQECIDSATSIVRRRIRHRRAKGAIAEGGEGASEMSWADVSLNAQEEQSENNELWLDSLPDERLTPEEVALRGDALRQRRGVLTQALNGLTVVERQVLTLRYGHEPRKTLQQVAQTLRLTSEGVRQIEKRSLRKLEQVFRRKEMEFSCL